MSHVVKDLTGLAPSMWACCINQCDAQQIEFLTVLTQMNLGAWLRSGFPASIEAGEWTPRRLVNLAQSLLYSSEENVRCLMGYIVDLTVILDDIFRTNSDFLSVNALQSAIDRFKFGRRNRIHLEIRSFVENSPKRSSTMTQRDLVLEKIMELIRQYCVSPSVSSSGWCIDDVHWFAELAGVFVVLYIRL